MTAKVLESFGGKFAEQWVATLLTPAFVFWLGGFAAIGQRYGWQQLVTDFTGFPELLQIAILIGGFCVIAMSAFVVQRFDLATLRFLEGYGSLWLRPVRRWRIRYYRNRRDELRQQVQQLRTTEDKNKSELQTLKTRIEQAGADSLNPDERDRFLRFNQQFLTSDEQERLVQLGQELDNLPGQNTLMPTRLGNLLRSAERKPLQKYGLDAVICWPRLWLLLSDATKKDLQEARADLNTAARVWLWSLLFCGWTLLGAWWAAPVGLLSAAFAYYSWMLNAAATYADLLEAAFDLYRPLLYQSLRWPLPSNPQEERQWGTALTLYLSRGLDTDRPTFTSPK